MAMPITKWIIYETLTPKQLHNISVIAYVRGVHSYFDNIERWIAYPVYFNGYNISPWLLLTAPIATIVTYEKAIELLTQKTDEDNGNKQT